MCTRTHGWIIVVSACLMGWAFDAMAADPNQYDYTLPARQKLGTATVSGLVEAYEILDEGLDNPNVTGDTRELKFLYALVRTGMLVLDTNDVAVTTSIVELVEPYGLTVSGDKLLVPDPMDPNHLEFMPTDPCVPGAFWIHVPVDPADPNCYLIPSGIDQTIFDTTASLVNGGILPEIDTIIGYLDAITDSPTPFLMILTPAETGLQTDVQVDRGDVLLFKTVLLAVKALLYGAANSPYDVTVDLANPLLNGWRCGELPDSTSINDILSAYPTLLEILTPEGSARLTQAKANLTTALDGGAAALDYIAAETDDQIDDLIAIDTNSREYDILRGDLDKLRSSLASGTAASYAIGWTNTFTVSQGGNSVGQLVLRDGISADVLGEGTLTFSDPNTVPAASWRVNWWDDDANGQIEGDLWAYSDTSYGAWFSGTISSDRSQITNLDIQYWSWSSNGSITGLAAQRTNEESETLTFDPTPLFAGTASPRDMLPQFDPNSEPIPGTVGHGLGDDATLNGVFPDVTQDDWMGSKYTVFGFTEDAVNSLSEDSLHYMSEDLDGVTELGESAGGTATFSGNYPLYIIAVQSETQFDSVYGTGMDYVDANDGIYIIEIDAFEDIYEGHEVWGEKILGAPDGQYQAVGTLGLLGQYTGFILVGNPGTWTSLTVVTDTEPSGVLHDWNGDGIVSIVGDVPPFVSCVYFNNCPGGTDTIAVGDCNGDGILSIVGDVPCFVDCVYFNNCPE